MITAAIWCAAIAVYGLYCVAAPVTERLNGWAVVVSILGVIATFAAPILATIAVNR